MTAQVGVVGVRGYAGAELVRILDRREDMNLAYAASRAHAGEPVSVIAPEVESPVIVSEPDPDRLADAGLDAVVLALPNGLAAPYVEALSRSGAAQTPVIVDFSADYRFDEAWTYGLPERGRSHLRGARRIANPGCYATAVQLALGPVADRLSGPASAFGVSGYSGAGTTPGPRNDVDRLNASVMPYALAGHGHEAEVRRHLQTEVCFTPSVAGLFRGLVAVVHAPLREPLNQTDAEALYRDAYDHEPLVILTDEPPELAWAAGVDGAYVGGVHATASESRLVAVCALDNLLKGASAQAVQNLALALGLPEFSGLTPPPDPQGGR